MSLHDLSIDELLPDDSVALRPTRVVDDAFRNYTALTAKDETKARSFCYMWLNRCRAMGMLAELGSEYAIIDVLNDNGDIVAEFGVTHKGFNYLRAKLKYRWERGA